MVKLKSKASGVASKPNEKKRIFIVSSRWILLATVFTYAFSTKGLWAEGLLSYWILVLSVVYNFLVSLYVLKAGKKTRNYSWAAIFLDIVLISVITAYTGGVDSDIYILYFFIIGHCGIYGDIFYTLRVGTFSIAAYSISSIYLSGTGPADFDYLKLVTRGIYLLLAFIGILFVNSEIKKYGEMHKREFKLARTDKLTGLANRHYFEQKLNEEVEYSDLSGMPINILIFDLDNFKRFNDTYGHVWGDKLLMLFSDIIKQNIRKSDIPVRYGGEEFLLLIRDLDIKMAKSVGERVRKQLEKQGIYVGADGHRSKVTVSCGVAQYPKDSGSIRQVVELADKALYRAKEIGKNIVVNYDEIDSVTQSVQIDIDSYMRN